MQIFYLLLVVSLQAGVFGQVSSIHPITSNQLTTSLFQWMHMEGDIRLRDDNGWGRGRLEVFRSGFWGTVCGPLEPSAAE